MALTFTSWTAYTDDAGAGKTLDWSLAGIRAANWRPYFEALRQACKGLRLHASSSSTLAAFGSGETLTYSQSHALDGLIDNTIAMYANHWDHGGDWNGQTEVPVMSQAALMADIGEGSTWLTLLSLGGINAEWIRQKYLALDRLLWVRALYSPPFFGTIPILAVSSQSRSGWNNGDDAGAAYARAVVEYLAAPWVDEAGANAMALSTAGWTELTNITYWLDRSRVQYRVSNITPDAMAYDIDIYLRVEVPIYEPGYNTFLDVDGLGLVENTEWRCATLAGQTGTTCDTPVFGDGGPPPAAAYDRDHTNLLGYHAGLYPRFAVIKFPGFNFHV